MKRRSKLTVVYKEFIIRRETEGPAGRFRRSLNRRQFYTQEKGNQEGPNGKGVRGCSLGPQKRVVPSWEGKTHKGASPASQQGKTQAAGGPPELGELNWVG